jgi:hypothetical protein
MHAHLIFQYSILLHNVFTGHTSKLCTTQFGFPLWITLLLVTTYYFWTPILVSSTQCSSSDTTNPQQYSEDYKEGDKNRILSTISSRIAEMWYYRKEKFINIICIISFMALLEAGGAIGRGRWKELYIIIYSKRGYASIGSFLVKSCTHTIWTLFIIMMMRLYYCNDENKAGSVDESLDEALAWTTCIANHPPAAISTVRAYEKLCCTKNWMVQ